MIGVYRHRAAWFSTVLIGCAAAAAACGSGAGTRSATPPATVTSSPGPRDLVQVYSARYAAYEAGRSTVSYRIHVTLMSSPKGQSKSEAHWRVTWHKDGFQRQRFDITGTDLGGAPWDMTIFTAPGRHFIVCNRMGDSSPPGCAQNAPTDDVDDLAATVLFSMGLPYRFEYADSTQALEGVTLTRSIRRNIAGISATCFAWVSDNGTGTGEECFGDDGVMLVDSSSNAERTVDVAATRIGRPPTDNDFVLPYPLFPGSTVTPAQ